PVMNARDMRAAYPASAARVKDRSVLLHDAVAASRFEISTECFRLIGAREWPDLGAVIDALRSKVDPPDDRLTTGEHIRVFGLQSAIRRLGVAFGLLRRHLDEVGAVGSTGCGCARRDRRGPLGSARQRRRPDLGVTHGRSYRGRP